MGLPRLLADIVSEAVAGQPDLTIVRVTEHRGALADELARTPADVVILSVATETDLSTLDPLLYAHSRLRMLCIVGDGTGALLYELTPRTTPIGDLSPTGLVRAITPARISALDA